ncbi:tRNA (guanine(46)-N(7))-methyltransferase [Fasciolopsis buskii]|uniref:tRNA (Guanine(46)-N(7))-methyltransferase n=1 Tax=Fasciolopsis buskii TaxID=27845 RepID=A0A8E0S4B7_9TREM|nr:tRNA (guanine(46)-N(7))-methyltransferase [Fasciolopsis buski]
MASVIGAFDRTGEFRACAKSFHQRIISGRAQLNPHGTSRLKKYSTPRSSEFLAAAQSLAGDLQLSLTKLRKLSLLLGEPSESTDTKSVSKLIEVIQCDIVDLNKALSALHITQSSTRSIATGGSSQLNKHQQLMITALEYRMSFLVSEFRRLLQENKTHLTGLSQGTITRPVSAESERNVASQSPTATSNFTNSTNPVYAPHIPHDEQIRHEHPVQLTSPIGSTDIWPTQPLQPPGHIHPPKPTGQGAQPVSFFIANPSDVLNPSSRLPSDSMDQQPPLHLDQQQQLQQLQLPIFDQEVRQRDAAMKRVESTIVQLGEIYQQFSSLVREQGDLVTRIDSQTEEADLNIGAAHEQLIAYFRSISTRRAFMVKVFIAILLCFVLFAWIR